MSTPENETLNRHINELRDQLSRLWHEGSGVPSVATAVKLDPLTQEIKLEIILPSDMSKDEVDLCTQRFLDYLEKRQHFHNRRKNKPGPFPSNLAESLPFADAQTSELLGLLPLIRQGIASLENRYVEALNHCRHMHKAGVVSYELAILKDRLQIFTELLDDLKDSLKPFSLFEKKECVLNDDPYFLVTAKQCLGVVGDLNSHLSATETIIANLIERS